MRVVHNLNDVPWTRVGEFVGGKGFQYKKITDPGLTPAYSAELFEIPPTDASTEHMEPYSHLLYILSGEGEIVVDGEPYKVSSGCVAQIRAGDFHSVRNSGTDTMVVIAIYDPPRLERNGEKAAPEQS